MNIAVLGAGSIIPDFMEAAMQLPQMKIYAIYGRESSIDKLTNLKEKYGMERIYHDYERLLSDEKIDAVYVALPNGLHYSFAKKAAEHGKHVILEKPFASNYEQAKDLVACAKENHVMVFEAISNQYLPNYKRTAELMDKIGTIKMIEMNFSQYSKRYDKFKEGIVLPVFDPKQSGGTLMDLNVYNIHYVVGLFGEPERVSYHANMEQGVDTSGILVMEYPQFLCVCIAAKDCESPASINIQGDKGYIHSDDKPNSYDAFSICLRGDDSAGKPERISLNDNKPRLYFELKTFVDMVERADFESYDRYCRHTLSVQKILDVARSQIGMEF
jgi:predicted dehydrogenase